MFYPANFQSIRTKLELNLTDNMQQQNLRLYNKIESRQTTLYQSQIASKFKIFCSPLHSKNYININLFQLNNNCTNQIKFKEFVEHSNCSGLYIHNIVCLFGIPHLPYILQKKTKTNSVQLLCLEVPGPRLQRMGPVPWIKELVPQ